MIGMSQQKKPTTGIKCSQSPGGRSSFAFSYEHIPPSRPIKTVVSAGKSTISLAWDHKQINKKCKQIPPIAKPTISLAWQTKDLVKRPRTNNYQMNSPDARNFYRDGKVVQRAGSPKPTAVKIRGPPGGHSSIKIG